MKSLLLILIFTFGIEIYAADEVMLIKVNSGIGPAIAEFVGRAVDEADKNEMEALVIELNTPGGLLESTRDIVSSILEAPLPVLVYVGPSGARAGSAGVFITMSANIAAMAPGTNIGAAHPVGMGGESGDSTDTMTEKVTNDAAAFARSIAQKRNRNEEWAEDAVRYSYSITENEALNLNVIDIIAENIDSLLAKSEDFLVETSSGSEILKLKDTKIILREMNWREEFLTIISDPNVAYIFILLAMYGVMFEFYSPGSIYPGVIGGISGIFAAYSLQMLPVNYVGLAFMGFAIILFVLEAFVSSYGMLTVGGIVSFTMGSIMLIESPVEAFELDWTTIVTGIILTGGFFLGLSIMGIKAQYGKKASGKDAMVGEIGISITEISKISGGKVKVYGEIWRAESEEIIEKDNKIEVIDVEGMTVKVKKVN